MLLKNKKAEGEQSGVIVPLILIIVMLSIILIGQSVYWITLQTSRTTVPSELDTEIILYKTLHDPSCFVANDVFTNKPYVGRIQVQKLSQQSISECFNADLAFITISVFDENKKMLKTASSKKPIIGSSAVKTVPVQLSVRDEVRQGFLEIKVVFP